VGFKPEEASLKIAFSKRSKFLAACEEALNQQREDLGAGAVVHVALEEGGYDGQVLVTIHCEDRNAFATDWERSDPTRFPVRIKAAATALLNCGFEGRFEISHLDGHLTIRAT
jgi:hypothetical protein